MALITLESGESFRCADDESVLRAGLRAGIGLSYECHAGGCGTCKIEVVDGQVASTMPDAPGLSDRDRRKGRFLACQCVPLTDCRIKARTDAQHVPPVPPRRLAVRLAGVRDITHDIREFRFRGDRPATFLPGQYALLAVDGGLRAYSMANLPNDDGEWCFHIRRVPGGRVSNALFAAQPGLMAELDGPFGLAHLRSGPRPVVCVAGGSGLAPMLSIARGVAADRARPEREVYFFHGGRDRADLLDAGWLAAATGLGGRLHYRPAASQPVLPADGVRVGLITDLLRGDLADDFDRFDFYCAGPPAMTQAVEDLLLRQAGLDADRLHFDRFF